MRSPRDIPDPAGQDRRVRRSRATLFAVAVRLISERGTTAVSVTELAEAADMSRQGIYGLFEDRESLFVAAGIDLIQRELFPELTRAAGSSRQMTYLAVRHLAHYRDFYRALAMGACAYRVQQAVLDAVRSWLNQPDPPLTGPLNLRSGDMLTTFVVGGMFAVFTRWLVDGRHPADLDEITDEVLQLAASLRAMAPSDDDLTAREGVL
ncbi:TetR/AcrR family transcriptional regulator [Nocardia sp. NPDC059177]|uniref:TetR/AcrR family transcriptional regulator n=1 Tax=Nocardia sp. NPDC059177 TaxID=3346759 RepID=UPI0036CFBD5A